VRVVVLSRPRADGGFTLVELLISITILGMVLAAISGVTFVSIRTAADADTRLTESNDLLRAATYFADDVQGAQSVSVGTTPRCGTDATAVVEFAGQDFADDSTFTTTTTLVSYVVRTVTSPTGPVAELHRLACVAGTATPAYPLVPVTNIPMVLRLSTTAPTVSCPGAPCGSFVQVDLTLLELSGRLRYTLTGRRRTTP
jgi:prepilin-type N-terminal cleavage/methylation domain-containing protein